MTQRPIDRKRDAGGIMEIGTPDDQSAITAIFPIGDDLYAVKERGIYEVRLADRIDPNRTNIAMPNTQQRVLNYGSDAPVVGRTLLTAKELFNPNAQKGGGVALPAVGNIAARCNDFVQKADHSLQSLLGKRYGASDPFSQYLLAVLPFLKFIRNARNCVEHPKDSQRIVARDFFPQADGTILPPTIEIIHPKRRCLPLLSLNL